MKHLHHLLATAALTLLCAVCFISCGDKDTPLAPNTNNPTEYSLKGVNFDLVALDYERGFSKDSNYVFEGVWKNGHFWFGKDKLDTMQLNITPDNGIVLKVVSDDPAFEGVNAASTSRCINIVPDTKDHTAYHLDWVEEGQSTITLWCGEGSAKREVKFVATSKKEIPIEGIKIRIDGVDGEMAVFKKGDVTELYGGKLNIPQGRPPKIVDLGSERYFKLVQEYNSGFERNNWEKHVVFEIAGPIPMNATPTETIYTAYDPIGMIEIDNVFGDPTNLYYKTDNFYYALYVKNLKYNPDFKWFHPFELRKELGDAKYKGNEQMDYYRNHDEYKLYPADLRERQCWIWPQTSSMLQGNDHSDPITIAFYLGEPYIESEGQGYAVPVIFEKMILFHNLPPW